MSLGILAVIGLAVGMMFTAATQGTSAAVDSRQVSVQQKMISMRLNTAVRASTKFLAAGDGYLVLWIADTNVNETPNLSELRRIDYDTRSGRLTSYVAQFPADWTAEQIAAADTEYDLAADFAAVTQGLKSGSLFVGSAWSSRVSGATFTLNRNSPQMADLVTYDVTLTGGTSSLDALGAAALRAE